MAINYREINFEEHVESHLLNSGYHKRAPEEYDKSLCLIPAEVIQFIQSTQPKAFKQLEAQYGTDTAPKLIERIAREVGKYGVLDVLRKGVTDRGAKFKLATFKPSSGMNPEHQTLYQGNRFSVVRQLKYSLKNENAIDMALFLNGLPIVTVELKNSLTGQTLENAEKQYKRDRLPQGEPLLAFKRCLVHFAVGNEQASMTTHLQGDKTRLFPFNKDTENPVNPNGHKTHYLWEDIWQADTLLELIHNYLHVQEITDRSYDPITDSVTEKKSEAFIFPRYHQLDVVRHLLSLVRADGVGKNYLVQHSAGSGKSNSIAWLAHQLASFYQKADDTERLFDSIIVVTDRRILDRQLQNTIKQFEQTEGVVKKIDKDSAQLRDALVTGKAIIITTLQKFPVISQSMTDLKGKRFAVIIDEAHSSQSGDSAKHLKKTLSVNLEQAEAQDEADRDDLEEAIIQEIRARGRQSHISYFAFTATPKNKTLELFGRKDEEGKPVAHHIYSMRQAIEENFILDVLKNYTTFARYFKLIKTIPTDDEYEKKKAIRLLTSDVDLTEHAIEQKTRIMLDHFLEKTVNAIQGKGRAMVVTRSRLHAVKFYLVFRKVMAEKNLTFKALVAFSGTVKDPDNGEHTENSLNQLPPRVAIEDAFKTPEYRLLVVANKYQTGFDEPLLHTMYVDKRLDGVQAVQTLSRLNRTRPGKPDTFILDFVNQAEDIQAAFQPYYQTTLLEEETDPNKLYDQQTTLKAFEVFTDADLNEFAEVFFTTNIPLEKLQPVLDRVVIHWNYKPEQEREDFRATLQKFIRLYGFIAQIITFEDVDLEKLYVFAKALNRKLPRRQIRLPYEIRDAVDLDSFRLQETYSGSIELEKKEGSLPGFGDGSMGGADDEKDLLSHIITTLNETYGINITEDDKVDIGRFETKVLNDEELIAAMKADNPRDAKIYKFNQVFDRLLLEFVHNKLDLYKKMTEPKVNDMVKRQMFESLASGAGKA